MLGLVVYLFFIDKKRNKPVCRQAGKSSLPVGRQAVDESRFAD
jgi:hypothetical protein